MNSVTAAYLHYYQKPNFRLRHFNASNNCLLSMPEANEFAGLNRLHVLYLAGNQLTESVVPVLVSFRKLRLLDVSYNQLRFFNDRYDRPRTSHSKMRFGTCFIEKFIELQMQKSQANTKKSKNRIKFWTSKSIFRG